MRLLLDTYTFLWIADGSSLLSAGACETFRDPGNEVFLSFASAWEIAVKYRLGLLPVPARPETFVPAQRAAHGIESLSIDEEAVLHLSRLPDLHRDPFDRILVAQAVVGGLVLLTPDEAIQKYPPRTLW